MSVHLKKLEEQVMVITGASSGIGLCTARLAARQGVKVVAASRNEDELKEVVRSIKEAGGMAAYCVADVARADDVRKIVDVAVKEFGGFDTWVNNAGVSIYGRLTETPLEEKRRLFDVNFWGVVHGSMAAVEHMRERGGAIINLGSVVSERAIPLQGIYSASKHAVKAYTDALRMELEEEGLPISVTLIKPTGINTPYTEHARNHMGVKATLPPPVYDPELVAGAILSAAKTPRRDVVVGGAGKMFGFMEKWMPRATDKIMEATMFDAQKGNGPPQGGDALFKPSPRSGNIHGDYDGHTMKTSAYTAAQLNPVTATILGMGLAIVGLKTLQVVLSKS